jgi:hypothetical protein
VANIIEFYIPSSFPRKVAWVSPARRGKVIEFSSRIPTKVTRIQKGAPILRSAMIGGLGLKLTDLDLFGSRGRTNCSGIELSPVVDYGSSSLQLTTDTLAFPV